jgi:secreted PhoX family phosphatase
MSTAVLSLGATGVFSLASAKKVLLHQGKLQAAAIEEIGHTLASSLNQGQKFGIVWKSVDPEKPTLEAEQKGCIIFSRLEGAYFAGGFSSLMILLQLRQEKVVFTAISLLITDANYLEAPDNICITPWGDLWIAEDGGDSDRIIGLTPEGEVYVFAENRLNGSELAGPTFSPDGKTFFVNCQTPGITFAILVPFASRNSARQRLMGHAAPPSNFAPIVSDKLVAFAENQGMSVLEAAALHRNGMPIL